MNIPQEFEDIFRGVELAEDEIRTLTWVTGWEHRTVENLRSAIRKAQATDLSTLQAENEKLRSEAEGMRSNWYKSVEKIQKLRAELEQVKRERDAAVKDMEALMWFSGEGCHICAHEIIIHREPYVRSECALGNAAVCCPTWRGPQKEG